MSPSPCWLFPHEYLCSLPSTTRLTQPFLLDLDPSELAEIGRDKVIQYYRKTGPETMALAALDPRLRKRFFTRMKFFENDIDVMVQLYVKSRAAQSFRFPMASSPPHPRSLILPPSLFSLRANSMKDTFLKFCEIYDQQKGSRQIAPTTTTTTTSASVEPVTQGPLEEYVSLTSTCIGPEVELQDPAEPLLLYLEGKQSPRETDILRYLCCLSTTTTTSTTSTTTTGFGSTYPAIQLRMSSPSTRGRYSARLPQNQPVSAISRQGDGSSHGNEIASLLTLSGITNFHPSYTVMNDNVTSFFA